MFVGAVVRRGACMEIKYHVGVVVRHVVGVEKNEFRNGSLEVVVHRGVVCERGERGERGERVERVEIK